MTTPTYTNPGWVNVPSSGIDNFAAYNNNLTFAPDGTPYLSFRDNDGIQHLSKFNGTSWDDVPEANFTYIDGNENTTNDLMYNTTVTFAPDGTLYQAFESTNYNNNVVVRKFDGTTWSLLGDPIPGNDYVLSLVVAPDGTPYATVINYDTNEASVKKFNGTAWVSLDNTNGVVASYTDSASLAFAKDGTPYLLYHYTTGDGWPIAVKKFVSGAWADVGSPSAGNDTANISPLVFAPNGTPYVAYGDSQSGSYATVKKFDGSDWVLVGTGGDASGHSLYDSNTPPPLLAFGPDGAPYVLNDSKNLKMFNGTSWVNVGGSSLPWGTDGSLAFAPNGTPYMAYTDGDTATPVVKKIGTTSSPSLSTVVTYHSGNIHSTLKTWTLLVTNKNSATGAATNAVLDSMSLTQTFPGGAPCTPVISALPTIGALSIGQSKNATVKINFAGCATNARFTTTFNFTDGGSAVGTSTIYNQVQ